MTIETMVKTVERERPNFGPTQITSITEIQPGMKVVVRRVSGEPDQELTIQRIPYMVKLIIPLTFPEVQNLKGNYNNLPKQEVWSVAARLADGRTTTIKLENVGVIPNRMGEWQQSRWLENPIKPPKDE